MGCAWGGAPREQEVHHGSWLEFEVQCRVPQMAPRKLPQKRPAQLPLKQLRLHQRQLRQHWRTPMHLLPEPKFGSPLASSGPVCVQRLPRRRLLHSRRTRQMQMCRLRMRTLEGLFSSLLKLLMPTCNNCKKCHTCTANVEQSPPRRTRKQGRFEAVFSIAYASGCE